MSGFVGLLNLDGEPVDRVLLERLTQFLAFRGPDEQRIYCQGPLGLGHAMLRATREAATEKQPAALGERLFIIADARIDARAELIAKLRAKNSSAGSLSLSTPDSELILRAYDCWGEACVENLLGDFSFAIWDARERRLFCARDQMGVKPLFYARSGSTFVFGNTLDCLRMHPAVSSRLNDLAIADFLLWDMNQEPSSTSFADIQRLPPAHLLVCATEKLEVRRYWNLCVSSPIQFRQSEEYIERFRELLDTAVADRLRSDSAGVLMSGGLDSTIVAASAQNIFKGQQRPSSLCAYTQSLNNLIPSEEKHYATITAAKLGIPIKFLASDHLKIFQYADQPEYRTPEPTHGAWPDETPDQLRAVAAQSRVVVTGYGGDPAFCGRLTVHFRQLFERKKLVCALADAARYLTAEGRFSRLYFSKRWSILFPARGAVPSYPRWLNEEFEKRLGLPERWESMTHGAPLPDGVRPEALAAILAPMWPILFEGYDPGSTRVPVDVRHPFFDLRLLGFLLALPRLPWCSDKELLRQAARGVLPDEVRLRRKSPLRAEPLNALLDRPEAAWVDGFMPVPELQRYVAERRIPAVSREKDSWAAWINLRPLSLNFWLRQLAR